MTRFNRLMDKLETLLATAHATEHEDDYYTYDEIDSDYSYDGDIFLDDNEFKRQQAELDAQHWAEQLDRLEDLKRTINSEIDAIRDTRAKVEELAKLQENPIAFVDMAAKIEKRDYSERREATLQRQLITVSNQIYTAQKRIAKAKRIAAGI